jgi:hypothetical protein
MELITMMMMMMMMMVVVVVVMMIFLWKSYKIMINLQAK